MDNTYLVEQQHPEKVDGMTEKQYLILEKINKQIQRMELSWDDVNALHEGIDPLHKNIDALGSKIDALHKIQVREQYSLEYIKTQTNEIMNSVEEDHILILQLKRAVERLNSNIDAFINKNGTSKYCEPIRESTYTVKSNHDKRDEIYQLGFYGLDATDKKAFSVSVVHKGNGERAVLSDSRDSNRITWNIPDDSNTVDFLSTHYLHFTGVYPFSVQVKWSKFDTATESKKFETGNDCIDFECSQKEYNPEITLFCGPTLVRSWKIEFKS